VPGLAARRIAADILDGVLHKHRTLDDQLDGAGAHPGLKTLADRDRALMRRLVATILRRLGTLGHLLSRLLDRGIPTDAPRAQSALLIGAAQILWMDVPDHAAVDLSVRLVQSDRRAAKYAGLVNAVLRRCAREGQPLIDEVKAQNLDIPPWLLARWIGAYGETTARQMALAIGYEPSLDITVKADAPQWASRLHGETLPTGTVRTLLQGSVTMLPGFTEGQWWVQDAAAALPARLFGDVAGKTIVDLCAAPGGKTAQLAQAGARVTAVDRSPARMARLRDNLARLSLQADDVVTDAAEWPGHGNGGYDGVLVEIERPLPLYAEIKIAVNLVSLGYRAEDVYGRIVDVREDKGRWFCGVEFTSVTRQASEKIRLFVQMLIPSYVPVQATRDPKSTQEAAVGDIDHRAVQDRRRIES